MQKVVLMLLILVVGVGFFIWQKRQAENNPFIPLPIAQALVAVEAGRFYPFPWLPEAITCTKESVGCFFVKRIDDGGVEISFPAFEIEKNSLKSLGFSLTAYLSRDGGEFELYPKKGAEKSKEEWVYALANGNSIVFLRYPVSVTRKANLFRKMDIDLVKKTLKEETRIETEEPLTLRGSGAINKAIPSASIQSISVEGKKVSFRFPNIINLNFPAGSSNILTRTSWRNNLNPVCPWTLYEAKVMSLPKELEMNIIARPQNNLVIRLEAPGLTKELWETSDIILSASPEPKKNILGQNVVLLDFGRVAQVSLKIKPVITVPNPQKNADPPEYSFAVLPCIFQS